MSIPTSELRVSLTEVLEEELPDQTTKERVLLTDALIDRLALDFDVVDDEGDEDEDFENEDLESDYPYEE